MGIKIRSTDEDFDRLAAAGTLAVVTAADVLLVPFSGSIKSVSAKLGVSGTQGGGGTTLPTLNLKKNGANMFADAAPITFASGAVAATYTAADFTSGLVLSVVKGDRITLDVTTLFNGAAPAPVQPAGACVDLLFTRRPNVAVTTDVFDPQDSRP